MKAEKEENVEECMNGRRELWKDSGRKTEKKDDKKKMPNELKEKCKCRRYRRRGRKKKKGKKTRKTTLREVKKRRERKFLKMNTCMQEKSKERGIH